MVSGSKPAHEASSRIGLRSLLNRMTTPRVAQADPADQIRQRGLLLLILFLLPLVGPQIFVLQADNGNGLTLIPTIIGLIITYFVLRRGHLHLGGWMLTGVLWLTALFVHVLHMGTITVISYIIMLLFPFLSLLVAQALLRTRWLVILLVITIAHLLTLTVPAGGITGRSDLINITVACIILNTLGTFAILNGTIQRARGLTEDALRASESRLRALSDHNVMGILLLRMADGQILYANATCHKLLGYPPDGLLEPGALRNVMSRELRLEVAETLKTQDQIEMMEVEATRRDGSPVWLNISLSRRMLNGDEILVGTAFDISARKSAEVALKESERRYGDLINSIDGVVWMCRADNFQTMFMTRQVEQVTGYRTERFYKDSGLWRSLVHPEDRPSMLSIAKDAIARNVGFQREYRLVAADGRIVWLRDIVSLDTINNVKIMRGLSINITESRQAQEAERAQYRLNDALRDTAVAINQTLDLNEVMRRILDQTYRVIPCEAADIILLDGDEGHVLEARGYSEFNHEEDLRRFNFNIRNMPTFQTMIRTGKSLRIDNTETHPMWRYHEATAWIRSTLGAPIQLDGETIGFLNVTNRRTNAFSEAQATALETFANQVAIAIRNARLYEQVLRDAEALESQVQQRTAELLLERQRIAAMLDSTGEGIFYTEGTEIRYVNQAMCTLTGYSMDELIGAPASILSSGDDQETTSILSEIVGEISDNNLWRGDLRLKRKDGSRFFAGLTVARVGHETNVVRAVSVMRDISKIRALQQQQSNLVAFASHELRTPITNLKTRLYLLRRKPEQLEAHLEVLDQVTERMRRLVEDLLNISRLERGVIPLHPTMLDIDHELRSVVDIQRPEAERKGLMLIYQAPEQPTFVEADSERLAQVITNLVTNAINYTPPEGSVTVRVECPPDEDMVTVHVSDTGVGIAPEHLPYIFQPFYRVVSHVEGTGLGLSIARQIVTMHGGELNVSSRPGQGSTFSLRLRRILAQGQQQGDKMGAGVDADTSEDIIKS